MPHRHYPPAYLRYFKARLWNLTRPGFWGTAIFLSVVGLVIKEYWAQPNFLSNRQENQVPANNRGNTPLSPEDKAIAADIDNLPLLVDDSVTANLPATTSKQNQAKNNKTLLERLNSQNQSSGNDSKSKASANSANSTSTNKIDNPFLAQAESLLKFGNFQDETQSVGVGSLTPTSSQPGIGQSSLGLNTGVNFRQTTVRESALQTALNQSTNQNQLSPGNTNSTQVNPFSSLASPISNTLAQNLTPNNGLTTNANNSSFPRSGYAQPGLTNPLQNSVPGTTGYPQPQLTQPQNFYSGTGYTQPGIVTQPQNFYSGTGYTQPGIVTQPQNVPQNLNVGTGFIQPGQRNLLPQNTISGTGYSQPVTANQLPNTVPGIGYSQPGLTNQPQNLTPGINYTQQGQLYQPQNFYTDRDQRRLTKLVNQIRRDNGYPSINSSQALPSAIQQTPVIPSAPAPYYNSVPNQGVTYTNPAIPNNYGSSGIQQPLPQNNYSYPTQIPGQ
ncbi:hypothetical protein NUACC21_14090 [Scytonema sp. NUACC21]